MAIKTMQKKRKAATTESSTASKKSKTSKSTSKVATTQDTLATTAIPETSLAPANEISLDMTEPASESEDDQTAALLKGFESASDSDDETHETTQDPSEAALDLSTLPDPSSALSNSTKKASSGGNTDGPTTLYISRIPHGFYEPQMHAYFSQFGDIRRLRMARNRRTGASKHYAFVEFDSAEVARIVQQTMDNYLMFKHILKVRAVPREQVHEQLWKGAGRRFRRVPWNRIEKSKIASTDREGWERRIKKESQRREEKREKLAALGYNFEAPTLRNVESVPKRLEADKVNQDPEEPKAVEGEIKPVDGGAHSIVTEVAELMEDVPTKKTKKVKHTHDIEGVTVETAVGNATSNKVEKKVAQGKGATKKLVAA